MRRKGDPLTERSIDRGATTKPPEWRYHATRPGRDTLAELFEQRYAEVIEAAWARLCAKYGVKA